MEKGILYICKYKYKKADVSINNDKVDFKTSGILEIKRDIS